MFRILLINILFIILTSSITTSNEIDFILVDKSSRSIKIFQHGVEFKEFKVSLGFAPLGTKVKKGDGKTPEGLYYIEQKLSNSSFFLALKISYPNPWDIRRALDLNFHPGGQIMIHGVPNSGYDKKYHNNNNDWTEGCIAVSNKEISFLWDYTNIGTPILIKE